MGRGCKNFASLHLLTHHNTTSKWKCIWGWAHLNVIASPRREQVKLHLLPLQTVHQLILVISHCTHYLVGMATASLQLEKRPKYNTGPPSWRPNNLQWSQIIQQLSGARESMLPHLRSRWWVGWQRTTVRQVRLFLLPLHCLRPARHLLGATSNFQTHKALLARNKNTTTNYVNRTQ